jgi:hypothetical protein
MKESQLIPRRLYEITQLDAEAMDRHFWWGAIKESTGRTH